LKECPLCGELMRLTERERSDRLPGSSQTSVRHVREWVCPECDYWEEAESGER
jgi:YgiT-type zinc finger domain-containing protein